MNKGQLSDSMRRLARDAQSSFPEMVVHHHLRDAARELDGGRPDNAKRHLRSAVASLAPLHVVRHGIHDDVGHVAAKSLMAKVNRHLLLVQDHADAPAAPYGKQFANSPERTIELVAQVREVAGI